MKSITLLLLALTYSITAIAAEGNCSSLKVTLKNNTWSDCALVKQYIIHGKLVNDSKIPELIPSLHKIQFEMSDVEPEGMKVLLTYQCGDDKEITIYSEPPQRKAIRFRSSDSYVWYVDQAALVEAKNMDATLTNVACSQWKPTIINWVFNP